MKTVLLRITGRVQGVWYRGWTVKEASKRQLNGWVRNRKDGSVEALLSGPSHAVDDMIAACGHGPPAAKVKGIEQSAAEAPAEPGFRQLPSC
jgi:acylphosphatase